MKRTTRILSLLLTGMLLFNSMVFTAVSEEALPSESQPASGVSAVLDSKYEAGDEIVEWREEGVKHYYLGDGQYQAVVSYTEPAAPGNKTQSYLTEAATRAATTGQVQTEQMPYDTYISATNKSNNYGAEEKLWVGTNDTTFIFDFLPTLPDNADVTAAQLYFSYYYNITTGYLTVGAYPVEFEWDELTLTWNLANAQENMGLGASCLGTTRLNGTRTITTTSVSVTDAVKSWYASKETNNYGIALKRVGGTNNSVILVPFDAYDNHAAYFVIDYILRDLPISNGLYYIRNGRLSTQFMQTDDGVMDDDDGDIEDMFYELWKLDCEEYQKWEIEYLHNGYYTISNSVGNGTLVLAVKEGNENTGDKAVIREMYTGHIRQQWKITLTSSGKYKIKPRSSENYSTDWVLCAGDGLDSLPNGRNVEQRTYNGTNDSYYDEWNIHKISTGTVADVSLLAIKEHDGRDRISCFASVMDSLYRKNRTAYNSNGFKVQNVTSITAVKCLETLQNSKVFVSRSHGVLSTDGGYTGICLNINGNPAPAISTVNLYNYNTNTVLCNLSNTELAIFVACQTAYSDNGVISICQAAVDAGADCAIGFTDDVNCLIAGTWLEKFFEYYRQGYDIEYCCQYAAEDLYGLGGVGSYEIFS